MPRTYNRVRTNSAEEGAQRRKVNTYGPSKQELLKAYHDGERFVESCGFCLESKLPDALCPKKRDRYRIVMTMILSGLVRDRPLTKSLARLFRGHPNFESLKGLGRHEIRQLLSEIGIGLSNPDRSGNGGRLWSLCECYFDAWGEKITEDNIEDLYQKRGFGDGKFVRALQAYCFGNRNVAPLDTPALRAIRDPVLPSYSKFSDDEIRRDIETKLRDEPAVSLVDFHEMLRFAEQCSGKSQKQVDDVMVGWNGWRLLCSSRRDTISEDWLRDYLTKDREMAKKIWGFYNTL